MVSCLTTLVNQLFKQKFKKNSDLFLKHTNIYLNITCRLNILSCKLSQWTLPPLKRLIQICQYQTIHSISLVLIFLQRIPLYLRFQSQTANNKNKQFKSLILQSFTDFALSFFTYLPESQIFIIFTCLNPVLLVPGFGQVSQREDCYIVI